VTEPYTIRVVEIDGYDFFFPVFFDLLTHTYLFDKQML